MRSLLRRVVRHDSDDTGTTMAETIVVMLILAVVLAIVQGTVIVAQKTTRQVNGRIDSAGQAKVAIDTMTRSLRTAVLPQLLANGSECTACDSTAFTSASPTSVTFYANTNTDQTRLGPMRTTFTLNTTTGILTETTQKPNAHDPTVYSYVYCTPGASCPTSTRIVARGVPTNAVLFTYYNAAGTALTGTTLSAAQLSQVDNIDVTVPVKVSDEITTLTQRVTLPNADSIALTDEET